MAGRRPQDVCLMRPRDIDREGEVWIYQPESHTTEHHGRQRVIALGNRAQPPQVKPRYKNFASSRSIQLANIGTSGPAQPPQAPGAIRARRVNLNAAAPALFLWL
jgi:hypothetical protein